MEKETINCSSVKPESWLESLAILAIELAVFEVEGIDIVVSIQL